MHDLAFEVPESVDVRPLFVVEQSASADEHVAGIFNHASVGLPDVDMPFALELVPSAVCDFVLELCESLDTIFPCCRFQIFANF